MCGVNSVKCYQNAELQLYGQDVSEGLTNEHAKSFRQKCDCLDGCTIIHYDMVIDRARLDWNVWDDFHDGTENVSESSKDHPRHE